jgi:hypothetical protein
MHAVLSFLVKHAFLLLWSALASTVIFWALVAFFFGLVELSQLWGNHHPFTMDGLWGVWLVLGVGSWLMNIVANWGDRWELFDD